MFVMQPRLKRERLPKLFVGVALSKVRSADFRFNADRLAILYSFPVLDLRKESTLYSVEYEASVTVFDVSAVGASVMFRYMSSVM